jgi:hypothetical protein
VLPGRRHRDVEDPIAAHARPIDAMAAARPASMARRTASCRPDGVPATAVRATD